MAARRSFHDSPAVGVLLFVRDSRVASMYRTPFATVIVLVCYAADAALAQNITLQQPVLRRFAVGTTVSVPDRGTAFIGGVGRAGDARNRYGPFRSGTSTGSFREQTSTSARVWIHDFDAMDRWLLSQPRPKTSTTWHDEFSVEPWSRNVAADSTRTSSRARSGVLHRQDAESAARRRGRPPRPGADAPSESTSSREHAERSYSLGKKAEERGAHGVALLHFRLAAKQGSKPARERLSKLSRQQGRQNSSTNR